MTISEKNIYIEACGLRVAIKPSKVKVYLFSLSCQCPSLDPGMESSSSLWNKWNTWKSQLGLIRVWALYSWFSGSEKKSGLKFLNVVACFSLFWRLPNNHFSRIGGREKDKIFSIKNYLFVYKVQKRLEWVGWVGVEEGGTETSSWPWTRCEDKGRCPFPVPLWSGSAFTRVQCTGHKDQHMVPCSLRSFVWNSGVTRVQSEVVNQNGWGLEIMCLFNYPISTH